MSLLFRSRSQGAQQIKISRARRFVMFWVHHLQQALGSLGELARYPMASLMTMGVLGLSLTLPATLYVVVKNTEAVGADWQHASEITVFLQKNLSEQEVSTFHKRLSLSNDYESVEWIDKDAGLNEFRELSGFGEALDALSNNPLPDVLVAVPVESKRNATSAKRLVASLERQREVEQVRLDLDWLTRLEALLNLIRDGLFALAVLLCIAVVLIVGNTIRLNINSKRDEIMVMKLVGATNAYIQRPFLYTGVWYGFVGGIIAWVATALMVAWISDSVAKISELYESQFNIQSLNLNEMLSLWLVAIGLGLLGSYIAVRKHVRTIEPQ